MTSRSVLNAPRAPIERLLDPFTEFAHQQASGGIILLVAAVFAFAWANSQWQETYAALWHTKLTIGLGAYSLSKPLELWINDGLMAIFFFVVGLEIKRELLEGELSTARKAVLPFAAALGGMLVPAGIYSLFNAGGAGAGGWGIPMATDIAFALGFLALLGDRVPLGLKVFLAALAIVDDLGAVVVIAFFYTAEISWNALGLGLLFFCAMIVANLLGVRKPAVYAILGVGLWVGFLKSGVHATIAGVLAAMTIPSQPRIDARAFLRAGRSVLDQMEEAEKFDDEAALRQAQHSAVNTLEEASEKVQSPLTRLEDSLHGWVAFFIMPVFAFANAGVSLEGGLQSLQHPVSVGVLLGLVLGKPIGITFFSLLAVRSGLASLPNRVSAKHLFGAGVLGGVGFTMSLFIAGLAFGDAELLTRAKLSILVASLVAGSAGWSYLRATLPAAVKSEA